MAQNAPNCKETQEIQFKLHDKFATFRKSVDLSSNCKLLAVSSSRGLLFAGNPAAAELKVIIIKDVASAKTTGKQPQARLVPLPNIPNYMSCSADGNLLAINYTPPNGTSLLLIYAVQSFMTAEVRVMYNIRLSPEDHVNAVQLLWNPVLPNSLAVVLSNGGLGMYGLKDAGNFELHTLDKSQQVKCGCWSPKGKQLVLGFPAGRLQQFKPDLTPAKTLNCPPNVHDAPFDTIAVHWLSTFQFAVVFLQHGQDSCPALYIMNAPKAGMPSYTNYYDICYSLSGPRNHQFYFTHVPQWNLLLVSSANGVEVGVLGTSESGDTPTWQQMTLLDDARIELPLSEDTHDETFPLGFVYDTSSTHQLAINEQQLPSMPMVHVLGSDGSLLAFNFLNLKPGVTSVCSPPPPLADTSGQFCPLDALVGQKEQPAAAVPAPVEAATPALSDISFAFTANTVTSTPASAKDKSPSVFAGFGNIGTKAPPPSFVAPAAPAASMNFNSQAKPMAAPPASFGGFGGSSTASLLAAPAAPIGFGAAPSFGGLNLTLDKPAVPAAVPALPPLGLPSAAPVAAVAPNNKPLYTVQPTFTPVAAASAVATKKFSPSSAAVKNSEFSARDVDDVIAEIMCVQINAFSDQIKQQKQQTETLLSQIESPSTIKSYAKRLDDLQELNEQANDVDFELDVQGLRHGLSEAYAMMAECRAKLEVYRNPDITRLMSSTSFDAAGRRMLASLQSYLSWNEAQLQLAQQLIDTQWEQYQDVIRRNSKSKMHMPCLEGIYQRLTRLQNLVSDQRITQTNIKTKLKERGLLQTALHPQEKSRSRTNEAVDTLADSILSMSLNQVVDANRAKLSQHKLKSIRQLLHHHKILIISPQRPDRVGLKSEVILETKLKAELKKNTAAAAAAAAAVAKPAVAHKATQAAAQLAKPTASKPATVAAPPAVAAEKPFSLPAISPAPTSVAFNFSQSSPFVKTTASTVTTTTLSAGEATKPTASMFGGAAPFSYSQLSTNNTMPPIGGLPKLQSPPTAVPTNLFAGFGSVPKAVLEPPKEEAKKELQVELKTPEPEPIKSATAAPKLEPVTKPYSFAGFGSNTGTAIGGSSTFNFSGIGSSLGNTAATTKAQPPATAAVSTPAAPPSFVATTAASSSMETVVSSTTSSSNSSNSTVISPPTPSFASTAALPTVSEPTSSSALATTISATPVATTPAAGSSNAESMDNLFGSVNICKPKAKESSSDAHPANIFSGFGQSSIGAFQLGSGGDAVKSLFGGSVSVSVAESNATTATAATPIIASATATPATTTPASATLATTLTAAPATKATPATATSVTATPATTASATLTPAATTAVAAPASTAVPASVAAAPGSSFSFSNAFSSLGTVSATPASTLTATSSAASTASNASNSIFGTTNAFAPAASAASPFSQAAAATPPIANLFGSVPKPEASVFGATSAAAPPSGLFAAASAANSSPSPFGGTPAATTSSTGNLFGQAAAATAAVKPSGFGAAPAAAGGSIFGGAGTASAASPFGGTSIFGGGNSAQSSPAGASGGSIFGQSVFSSTATPAGGNLFGNASPAQPQASPFGGGGSLFGAANTASAAASGGSIFGGGAVGSGGFGSFAQSTPAPGGFGSGFAQTSGASVAQSGFGSPQQQAQQSPAAGFGAKPVFGGSPAFGASPTFGGAPTFGSPKGFGSFGNNPGVVSPPSFGGVAKAPEGNIFETLGGTDTGLSFGNLAQTGNPNAQKSAFGGSSFMNYR